MKKFWQRPTEIVSHDIVTTTIRAWKTEDFQGMSWSEPLEWLTRDLQHEAQLSDAARATVRDDLLGLFRDRAVGGKTGVAERDQDGPFDEPRTVIIAGLDPLATARVAEALGARDATRDPLRHEFCGLEWELDFHLPHMAEWQAEDTLAEQYAGAARRSSYEPTNAIIDNISVHVWAGFGHAEHLTQIRLALPNSVIVYLSGCNESSAGDVAAQRRTKFSDAVDADKVRRYFAFRIGVMKEKAEAQLLGFRTAGDQRLIEVDAAVALANTASLSAEIAQRLAR